MTDHLHALPPGHRLGEYRMERVLGSGGFGITYYAWDLNLDKPVAVKEYLPNEFALRTDTTTVRPKSRSDEGDYRWGLKRFLDEARTLARFKHPHLNEVHRYFEDNNTAYIVLEYLEGETLSELLRREPRLDEVGLRRLLEEMLSGLEEVHGAGFVHRDIKPGNIILRKDGSSVLLDFGAARQAVGQRSKSITSVLTPGYAPVEQYDRKAEDVGPWSDLYALGMVAYRCISGLSDGGLPDAVARARLEGKGKQDKDLKPALEVGRGRYSESLLEAVDWAIRVDEEARPQSVAALREVLGGRTAPLVLEAKAGAEPKKKPGSRSAPPVPEGGQGGGRKKGKAAWAARAAWGLLGMLGVAGAVGLFAVSEEWLYWREVDCGEESQVSAYLEKYPGGSHAEEAQACMAEISRKREELLYWREVDCGEESQVSAYLEKYPGGAHAEEAQACMTKISISRKREELLYWREVDCGEESQVSAYLEKYPGGAHAEEAQACMAEISRKREADFAKINEAAAWIAAGVGHTCALLDNGNAGCWGENDHGRTNVPAGLAGRVRGIAAGERHTCALLDNGNAVCWGDNGDGETDVPAGLAGRVRGIAAVGQHTCAVTDDGNAGCWGYNEHGETDVPAGLAGRVRGIAAGWWHTCAVTDNGNAVCWGRNNHGQTNVPAGLAGRVRGIAAGGWHTCAVTDDGNAGCWGDNKYGKTNVPAGLAGRVRGIAAGGWHTCAVTDDGNAGCWGRNDDGQTNVPAGLAGRVRGIAAGGWHTCAVTDNGNAGCWGRNKNGETNVPAGLAGRFKK